MLNHISYRQQKRDLRVIVGTPLNCMLGEKARTVGVNVGNDGPVFKKNGTGLVLHWPSSHSS